MNSIERNIVIAMSKKENTRCFKINKFKLRILPPSHPLNLTTTAGTSGISNFHGPIYHPLLSTIPRKISPSTNFSPNKLNGKMK